MPQLEHDDAIKQYYEEVKHLYPDVSFIAFDKICRTPFKFVKGCIKSLAMPFIRLKYIGEFRIFPSAIKQALTNNKTYFTKGIISEEEYTRNKIYYLKYLEELQVRYDNHKNKVKPELTRLESVRKNKYNSFELIDDTENE